MGRVVLIGAGPGAEDLITVRGLKLLMQADCVFYDALVSPSLLSEARSDAKLVAVGNAAARNPLHNTSSTNSLLKRLRSPTAHREAETAKAHRG